eukprot:scaffold83043_cov57-Phaeocystis_antarctica.AAC.4
MESWKARAKASTGTAVPIRRPGMRSRCTAAVAKSMRLKRNTLPKIPGIQPTTSPTSSRPQIDEVAAGAADRDDRRLHAVEGVPHRHASSVQAPREAAAQHPRFRRVRCGGLHGQFPPSVRLQHVAQHGGDPTQGPHKVGDASPHVRGQERHWGGEEGPVEVDVPQHPREQQREDKRDQQQHSHHMDATQAGAETWAAGSASAFGRHQRGNGATE